MFVRMKPMPSPRGTNREQLFVPASVLGRGPTAAYDAAPRRFDRDEEEETYRAEHVCDRLRRMALELSPEEQERLLDSLRELLAGGSVEQWLESDRGSHARDEPPPFAGRPGPRGGMDTSRHAMDSRSTSRWDKRSPATRSFERRFNTGRIRVM